jgi:transcriptional regulator NrdR family protein
VICPECGTWTLVKQTRKKPGNETYRRYECANLHRFSTREKIDDSKASVHSKQKAAALGVSTAMPALW